MHAYEWRHQLGHVGDAIAKVEWRQARAAQPSVERAQQRPHARPVLEGAQRLVGTPDHPIVVRLSELGERGCGGTHQEARARGTRS